jgi:hypothetical protein
MRYAIIWLCFLLWATSLNGIDATEPKNGNWWLKRDESDKLWFVEGYVEGISRADKILSEALAIRGTSLESSPNGKPVTFYLDFTEISYGQFMRGLDEFYKDYRNTRINVNYALLWVRNSIRGDTETDLQKQLEGMRKAVVNPDYDKEN